MNTTCPSGCAQREPATTNARPAAFSMTSSDIRMNSRLRRTSSPMVPSANKIPARIRPCVNGIDVMSLCLRFATKLVTQVVGAHQAAEQKHGCEFNSDQVRPIQREPDLLRVDHAGHCGARHPACENEDEFGRQDDGKNDRP